MYVHPKNSRAFWSLIIVDQSFYEVGLYMSAMAIIFQHKYGMGRQRMGKIYAYLDSTKKETLYSQYSLLFSMKVSVKWNRQPFCQLQQQFEWPVFQTAFLMTETRRSQNGNEHLNEAAWNARQVLYFLFYWLVLLRKKHDILDFECKKELMTELLKRALISSLMVIISRKFIPLPIAEIHF